MGDPKKSALAIILGGKPPMAGKGGDSEDLEAAAGDLLSAIKANDQKATAAAFKSMAEICESYEDSQSGAESEPT